MSVWSKLIQEGSIAGAAALALMIGIGAATVASAEEKPAEATEEAAAGDEAAAAEDAAPEEAAAPAEEEEVDWEDKPYKIVDGKVDFNTYNGFRRYHGTCHTCHGPDAMGSSYAPALIESIPRIGYDGYLEAVVNGIKNVNTSEQSVMPAFGEVPDVMNYIDDIYAYLKARADGALGRGRPERLPKEES